MNSDYDPNKRTGGSSQFRGMLISKKYRFRTYPPEYN